MAVVGLLLQLLLVAPASAELSFDKWYDQFDTMCTAKQLCSFGAEHSAAVKGHPHMCNMAMCMVYSAGKQYLVMGNQKMQTDPAVSKCYSKCIEDHFGNLDKNSGRQCKDQCTTQSWGDFAGNMASVAAAAAVANRVCSDEFPEQLEKWSATQFEKITGRKFADLVETGEESALDSVEESAQEDLAKSLEDGGVNAVDEGAEQTWGEWIGSWFKSAGEDVENGVEFAEEADRSSWKNDLLGYIKKPDTFPAGDTLVLNISQAEDLGELLGGGSWAFLIHHLNSGHQQQFLVLNKDSFFHLHSLLKARISDDLVTMNAPPTFLGFQLSFATVGLGLVSLTMLALWKKLCQDDEDWEDDRCRRRGMGRAVLLA